MRKKIPTSGRVNTIIRRRLSNFRQAQTEGNDALAISPDNQNLTPRRLLTTYPTLLLRAEEIARALMAVVEAKHILGRRRICKITALQQTKYRAFAAFADKTGFWRLTFPRTGWCRRKRLLYHYKQRGRSRLC